MPKRKRLFSLHTAHILSILRARPAHRFFVGEVIDKCDPVAEGSVRSILQRLFNDGLAYRYDNGVPSPNHATVQYQVTERGKVKADDIAKARTPKAMLAAWRVEDDEDD